MFSSLIIGAGGQDGQLLSRLLRSRGEKVFGISRSWVEDSTGYRRAYEPSQWRKWVLEIQPERIYYLAAFHHASSDLALKNPEHLWDQSYLTHQKNWQELLECVRERDWKTRLFYAASSLVFGNPIQCPQNETTPLDPVCIYGITKTGGVHLGRFYRESHGMHISIGFLYTHESSLRAPNFVSQKIIRGLKQVANKELKNITLGSFSSIVDWSDAEDVVEAMRLIMDLPSPEDYVISRGEAHTVEEFARVVCDELRLDFEKTVIEDSTKFLRRRNPLVGDSSKLCVKTGWKPSMDFESMVRKLVRQSHGEHS